MQSENIELEKLLSHGKFKTFSENYLFSFLELEKLKLNPVIDAWKIEKLERTLQCLDDLNHTWKSNLAYLFDPYYWNTKMLISEQEGTLKQRFPRIKLVMFFTTRGNLSLRWRPVEHANKSDFIASGHFIENIATFSGSFSERPVNEILFLRSKDFSSYFHNDQLSLFNIHASNCLISLCNNIGDFLSQYFSAEIENEIGFVQEEGIISGWDIYDKLDKRRRRSL